MVRFLVFSFSKNKHILSLSVFFFEAVDNCVPDFEELSNKLIWPVQVIVKHGIGVHIVGQVAWQLNIRLSHNLEVVHEGIYDIWQGPFSFLANS